MQLTAVSLAAKLSIMISVWFDKSMPRVLVTLALKKIWPGAVLSALAPTRSGDLALPELPGDRWVRVRNRLCGVCGSDLHLVYVDADPKVQVAALPGYDRIYVGHEVIGVVEQVGPAVSTFKPGDRVVLQSHATCASQEIEPTCRHCAVGNYSLCENQSAHRGPEAVGGGWSEQMVCHEAQIFAVPDQVSDEQAIFLEPFACSLRAALRRTPAPGERTLVVGCGIIGLGLIQALRKVAPEAEIYAVARHAQQKQAAQRFGAALFEPEDVYEGAAELTGGHAYRGDLGTRALIGGFDVVYDCVGNDATVDQSLRLSRGGGAVVVVGVHLHRMKVDLTSVWHQEVDLVGSMVHGVEEWQGERLSTYDRVSQWLADGTLETEGLATHRFPLREWKKAVKTAADKRSGAIKVTIELGS